MLRRLPPLPPVSQYPNRTDWEKACWGRIAASPRFLPWLTTAKERHLFVQRIAIIDQIRKGRSYAQISKELLVSPQTISVIQKALREKALKSHRQRDKTERKPFPKYRTFPDPLSEGRPKRTKYGTIYVK